MFIKDKRLGRLKNPVAGVVFHFGEGGAASQPCEAAWIASCSDSTIMLPKVVVCECSPSFSRRESRGLEAELWTLNGAWLGKTSRRRRL